MTLPGEIIPCIKCEEMSYKTIVEEDEYPDLCDGCFDDLYWPKHEKPTEETL